MAWEMTHRNQQWRYPRRDGNRLLSLGRGSFHEGISKGTRASCYQRNGYSPLQHLVASPQKLRLRESEEEKSRLGTKTKLWITRSQDRYSPFCPWPAEELCRVYRWTFWKAEGCLRGRGRCVAITRKKIIISIARIDPARP